ncbi:radial spoke head 10 homolog B-like [Mangifera indica]|uniref:radial spoke head 10 homolog B-like n=1 Tax=Mangifera indica TaxID=29780 RepID=UPI001CFBB8FD|nr:radial spoke head 10 homolog B-like [Mangifera indica]XP_044479134.1 radial spoke head 10 homolog B-like [Mangifera indica]
MESHKLTRTQSSLLRSSPTIRSSIHSLNSVAEAEMRNERMDEEEGKGKEQELLLKQGKKRKKFGFSNRTGSARFLPVFAMASFSFFTLFSLFLLVYFLNMKREEIPTSENLLLALIFVAITLFLANKNKNLIRQITQETTKRFTLTSRNQTKPIHWFIGESDEEKRRNEKVKKKKIVREGVEFYSNGDFYEGEFHKGKCSGSGVYNYFVNGRYEGEWVDGKYDGYGIESWARGSRYKGQYRQGLRHGYGIYRFYTGDSYAGQWCNGQSHGVGVQTCADGSSYVGEFKCGVKHGLGRYHFRNGDQYSGEYFGDKVHGFGVYHFANGHCYEGSWHEGRKQGYGLYTFRNGDKRCGGWDCGNLKTPLPPHTDSVLRAVEGARKAADHAIHLHRVDEQVNKAVLAANRAATAARVAAVKAVQNRMDGKFCDIDE